jgi:SAM-dependent methyltransferase
VTSRDGRAGRAATDRPLPEFTEHAGNVKTRPLDDGPRAPAEVVRSFVRSAVGHAEPRPLRVLDVGCGRGDTVAWLLDRGVEAYGIDVRADYLANGREYLDQGGHDGDRLRLLEDGRYPFEDATFDVVLSDQVLEHVADLAGFVGEVARVSRPGSAGLHVFPARWRPVEVHMRTPLVHWLPKGRARRAGLRAALAVGAAAPYFRELDGADRCEVFARYRDRDLLPPAHRDPF